MVAKCFVRLWRLECTQRCRFAVDLECVADCTVLLGTPHFFLHILQELITEFSVGDDGLRLTLYGVLTWIFDKGVCCRTLALEIYVGSHFASGAGSLSRLIFCVVGEG